MLHRNRLPTRLTICAVLLVCLSPAGRASTRVSWASVDPLLERADSLQSVGAEAAAFALLDSLQALSDAGATPNLRVAITMARAHAWLVSLRADEAASAIRGVLPMLVHDRDTLGLCRAWRDLARADELQGRSDEARAKRARSLSLARQAHLELEAGRTWAAIAAGDFDRGQLEPSITNYRRALRALTNTGNARDASRARAGLAGSLQFSGRIDEARRELIVALAEARRRADAVLEGQSVARLGSLELTNGDPRLADSLFRCALQIYQRLMLDDRVLWATNALSIVYLNLDRVDEADSTLMSVASLAKQVRNVEYRSRWLCEMGVVRRVQGRLGEAEVFGRRAVAQTDSVPGPGVVSLIQPLIATLRRMQRQPAALALIDSQLVRVGARLPPAAILSLAYNRGSLLQELGKPREALQPLRNALGDLPGSSSGVFGTVPLDLMGSLAGAYWSLGQRDSALIWYRQAADCWEKWRSTTADPLWREKYDDYALSFAGPYAIAQLDSSRGGSRETRVREACDAMQRFRARTLADRVYRAGPQSQAMAVTARSFEIQHALLPGEVLIDLHAAFDTSVVFAITREAIRAYTLPRAGRLGDPLRRLRDLLSDPSEEETRMLTQASAALGSELLGPAADLMIHARRVLFAGGSLAEYPFAMLTAPGERATLLEGHECAWVPSAGLLVRSRNSPPPAGNGILAIAPAGAGAKPIPGAQREAEWMSQHFAQCDRLANDSTSAVAELGARAGQYAVLHFAAHTRSGGTRPWQDAIRVSGARSDAAWLTAAQIAQFRAPASLCVLAACTSVGGEPNVVETMQGLSSAWLAAGVRTVIATQWPVDDEATWQLMRGFYSRLAQGQRAGEALRGAQLELRDQPGFSSPRLWAAAVLVGDPDTRVKLEPRSATAGPVTGRSSRSSARPRGSRP